MKEHLSLGNHGVREAAATMLAEATAAGVSTVRKDAVIRKAEARGTQSPRMVLRHRPLAREPEVEAEDPDPAQGHQATGKAQETHENA